MKVFGEFAFDERARQLRRGESIVPLQGQSLDLLVLLLDRAGHLITREEIRSILWPDSNVDFEHSLDVLVNRLRMTLGDTSKSARYIQTVPKKGYRFVEQVRSEPGRNGSFHRFQLDSQHRTICFRCGSGRSSRLALRTFALPEVCS